MEHNNFKRLWHELFQALDNANHQRFLDAFFQILLLTFFPAQEQEKYRKRLESQFDKRGAHYRQLDDLFEEWSDEDEYQLSCGLFNSDSNGDRFLFDGDRRTVTYLSSQRYCPDQHAAWTSAHGEDTVYENPLIDDSDY